MCYVNFKGSSLKINIGLGSELRIVYIFCHEVNEGCLPRNKMGLDGENLSLVVWEQQRCRPACAGAHPRSLISTFVIGLLESIISRPYLDLLREKFQFSSDKVAVTEHAGLNLT